MNNDYLIKPNVSPRPQKQHFNWVIGLGDIFKVVLSTVTNTPTCKPLPTTRHGLAGIATLQAHCLHESTRWASYANVHTKKPYPYMFIAYKYQ